MVADGERRSRNEEPRGEKEGRGKESEEEKERENTVECGIVTDIYIDTTCTVQLLTCTHH